LDYSGGNPQAGDGGDGGFGAGGALFNYGGALTIINSTLSGNTATGGNGGDGGTHSGGGSDGVNGDGGDGLGGALFNRNGTVILVNSTIVNNSVVSGTVGIGGSGGSDGAAESGGAYNHQDGGTAALTLVNTILANTPAGQVDCYNSGGTVTAPSTNRNLIEANPDPANTCGTPYTTSDPNLGSLADNGGDTQTHAFLATSPAVNAVLSCTVTTDQRGASRPQGAACDIGAYEQVTGAEVFIDKTVTPSTALSGQPITYTLSFANLGAGIATGVVITDIVPTSVAVTGVFSSGAVISQIAPGYVWSVGDLSSGAGGIITITGQLSTTLSPQTLVANSATITTTTSGDFADNNISSADVLVAGPGPGGVGTTDGDSDLRLWLKADAGTSTTTNGGTVYTWSDQSGNGNDTTVPYSDPAYAANATNGRPAITFDSDDYYDLPSDVITDGTSYMMFGAAGLNSRFGYHTLVGFGSDGDDPLLGVLNERIVYLHDAWSTQPWNRLQGTTYVSDASYQVWGYYKNGSNSTLTLNGKQDASTSIAINAIGDPTPYTSIGSQRSGGDYWDGNVAEIIFYDAALINAQRTIVGNYLSAKYDIPLAANDVYTGDDGMYGDYDTEVFGIGRESDGTHAEGRSAGLVIVESGGSLDNGEYVLAGHKVATNGTTTADVPAGVGQRWARVWNVDKTGSVAVTLAFDFGEGGMGALPSGEYALLYSGSNAFSFVNTGLVATISGDQVQFTVPDGALEDGYYTLGVLSPPELGIAKTVTPTTAVPGEEITYTLTFSNAGGVTATGVVISDSVPVSLTVQRVISSGVTITDTTIAAPDYVWGVQNLALRETGYITIAGVLDSPLAAGTFTNTARIACAEVEGDTANNSGSAGVMVINVAPVASDDEGPGYVTDEESVFTTADVLSNDDDQNDDTLSVGGVFTSITQGSVTDNGDGTFGYDPDGQFEYLAVGEQADDTFIYAASDGGLSDTATVTLTINGVNDAPTANDDVGAGFTTDEDSAFTTGNVLGNDTDLDLSDVRFVASFDATGVTGQISHNGDGTFNYDPDGHFESLPVGWQTIETLSYVVSDGTLTDTATVSITIDGVNDAPTIANIPNLRTTVGVPVGPVPFTVGDVDTNPVMLELAGESSDTALLPPGNIVFGGSGVNRSIILYPVEGLSGAATITVTVADGLDSSYDTLVLAVDANSPPEFTSMPVEAATVGIPYTYAIVATDNDRWDVLTITAPISDTWLHLTQTSTRTAILEGTPPSPGEVPVELYVSDGQASGTQAFTITITAPNTPPTISNILNQTTDVGVAVGPIPFTVGDAETPAADLVLSRASSNPVLVLPSNVVFGGNGVNRTVTIIPTAGMTGTARITITVSDGELSAYDTLVLSVGRVNSPPEFASTPVEEAIVGVPYTYPIAATDADAGDTLTFAAPISATWLTLTQITSRTAVLSGTPSSAGQVPIELCVSDGKDSDVQGFTITVISQHEVYLPLVVRNLGF
jgi:uncharacterized repeat protein (TIGR01451 family)